MAVGRGGGGLGIATAVKVFKVGCTLEGISSFSLAWSIPTIGPRYTPKISSSRTTRDFRRLCGPHLRGRNQISFFGERAQFLLHCFSSGGNPFTADMENGNRVWSHHISWKRFQCQVFTRPSLQFSILSSILSHSEHSSEMVFASSPHRPRRRFADGAQELPVSKNIL